MSFDVGSTLQEIESERVQVRTHLGKLDAAYAALEGLNGTMAPESSRTPASPPATQTQSRGQRGRPRGSGNRAQQAIKLVQKTPGITIPQIAKSMGIEPNYLYRVMPKLANEGTVRRDGQGWHPVTAE